MIVEKTIEEISLWGNGGRGNNQETADCVRYKLILITSEG
jgi:hypothetical protein